jgi:hypothetical protein
MGLRFGANQLRETFIEVYDKKSQESTNQSHRTSLIATTVCHIFRIVGISQSVGESTEANSKLGTKAGTKLSARLVATTKF